ncbi:Mitochondrial import inner membrane translocase subunit TIM50 [Morella rubra]|uniref:Mitochondrial import inner membrane translocase subunit TIM50 n=1 Tax=Morella rubra TaxID=262757 RepID=A0A6A1VU89_9ROSI|nr:Mitochondrial import inner membrane translocase subunit TIM50 [Morella rubra]
MIRTSTAILRSHLGCSPSKRFRRLLSSNVVSGVPKEPLAPSAATATAPASAPPPPPNNATAATSTTPLPSATDGNPTSSNKGWRFLKYSLFGALTGATAAAGYATYAYTSDEIDDKTRALRTSVNFTVKDDTPAVDKVKGLLYSAAMTVPSKAIDLYLDLRRLVEEQVQSFSEPYSEKLLPDLHPAERHVFTLVLDLQETLIHYDWTREKGWQTLKRPGVDAFLEHLAQFYEIIVYSDEQSMFVDPVVERLDPKHCIRYRLSKGATKYQDGKHYRVYSS